MFAMARKGVADLDKRNRVASRKSKYGKRLRRLTKGFKELVFVIGHEIGHVAEGHSKKRFKAALLTGAGREDLGKWGSGKISALSSSQLGDFVEVLINARFSQANEKQAKAGG